jgi:hypothetical protein
VNYGARTDTLSLVLRGGVAIAGSDEEKRGAVLDSGAGGNLVSLEILDASRRVTDARNVEFLATGAAPSERAPTPGE